MEHYEIWKWCILDLTINNHKHAKHNIVKFFSSVKLDTSAKFPNITCDIIFKFCKILSKYFQN